MKSFLHIQPSYIKAVHKLAKDNLFLGITKQNLNGLLSKVPSISFIEGIRTYASIFPILEWKADLNTPFEEHLFESIIDTNLQAVSFRVQAQSLLKNIDNPVWHNLTTLMLESRSKITIRVILSADSTLIYSEETLRKLLDIREHLYPLTVFFELEHRSWKNPTSRKIFHSTKAGVIQRDMPSLFGFQVSIPNTNAKEYYLRLLGRNNDNWFSKENTQKYLYDYTRTELLGIINERSKEISECESTTIIATHHTPEHAVANILEFAYLLQKD